MNNNILNVRISENEFEALETYARRHGRTKSEIVREFLRSLERKLERPVSAKAVSARASVSARPKPKRPKGARP
jgi:predicted DNA-binding protein